MLAPDFEVRVVTVDPGSARPYREADWRDALVLVRSGEIELEGLGGWRRAFASGAVLCLDGLQLRRLRNRGEEPVFLVAVAREISD